MLSWLYLFLLLPRITSCLMSLQTFKMMRPAILNSEVCAAPQTSFSASILQSEDEPFTRDNQLQKSISKTSALSKRNPQENICISKPIKMSGSHLRMILIKAGKRSFSSATYWISWSVIPDRDNKDLRWGALVFCVALDEVDTIVWFDGETGVVLLVIGILASLFSRRENTSY